MSRIKQGWELTKKSWALLRSNRQLFRFPIYGALAALVVVIVFVGPGLYLIDDGQRVLGGLLTAVGLYGSSFVAIYFGVALAATADAIFHGRTQRSPTASPSLASGSARSPAGRRWRRWSD